jgi:hypothetical protein
VEVLVRTNTHTTKLAEAAPVAEIAGCTKPIATLDRRIIERACNSFPNGGDWQQLNSRDFLNPNRKGYRNWRRIDHLETIGGVYAFLLPAAFFSEERTIHLHSTKGSTIEFVFTAPAVTEDGYAVLYVGRTANFRSRFQEHHSTGNRQAAAQVKYGLIDCGICHDQREAIAFLHEHARIMWHRVSGKENAANRDLIELTLCAQWMPPFNIKAER